MRILLIDTAFLGDLFLATPLIRAAAEIASGGRIDLLTSPAGKRATLHHPLLGDVHAMAKRGADAGAGGFRRALAWLRERRHDVALMPRRSLRSALLARTAGIPRRLGFRRGVARLLLTDAVPFRERLHQVERNLELLRPLGVDPAESGLPGHPLEAFPSAAEQTWVDGWCAERGLKGFVALAPGSVWATKRWPVEMYADLATRLARDHQVVIIGGESERPLATAMQAAVTDSARRERIHDASGPWSPMATVHLLRSAGVLVTNDSGALHIGQAAGVPIVALFGPTVPALGYAPRGEGHRLLGVEGLPCRPCGRHGARRCPLGHWRCMLDLSPDGVEQAVRDLLRDAA